MTTQEAIDASIRIDRDEREKSMRWERTKLIAQMAANIYAANANVKVQRPERFPHDCVMMAREILAAAEAAEAKTI